MQVQQLFEAVPDAFVFGNRTLEIAGLQYDSRRVRKGDLFFAIPGTTQDGARFIPQAIANGALAIAAELPPDERSAPGLAWIRVTNARRAMALAADRFYEHPSLRLKVVGITGTNGKTTVSYLLASILKLGGLKPALFGTIEYRLQFGQPDGECAAPNTTPESIDLQRMLAEVAEKGGRSAVMEVSSHALALERVAGCHFHTAVFTNFSRDHLDFHGDLESYFAAKAKLFLPSETGDAPEFAVLNADDPRSGQIRSATPCKVFTYGLDASADVTARNWTGSRDGLEFIAVTPSGTVQIRSPLAGRHNVYNLLAATAAAQTLNIPASQIAEGVKNVRVPGRLQSIDQGQPFGVFVDYAHTDDGLRNLVSSVREWSGAGRIILVFGCGGDRDRTKRPLMGAAAGAADFVVLTSDNPRSEDPLAIIGEVIPGLERVHGNYRVEPERNRAIAVALKEARPGDTVLLAGKGHEKYQIIGMAKVPFDDCEAARSVLREMGYAAQPK